MLLLNCLPQLFPVPEAPGFPCSPLSTYWTSWDFLRARRRRRKKRKGRGRKSAMTSTALLPVCSSLLLSIAQTGESGIMLNFLLSLTAVLPIQTCPPIVLPESRMVNVWCFCYHPTIGLLIATTYTCRLYTSTTNCCLLLHWILEISLAHHS